MQIDEEPDERRLAGDLNVLIDVARALLLEATFDAGRWHEALNAVAAACGARSGQVIALNHDRHVVAHHLTGVPDGFTETVEAFGLANPVINPRVRIGASAPLMQLVADQDFVDAEMRARNPIYAEMFYPYDLAHNCQVVLLRDARQLVRASITRTRKQGPLDDEAFAAFAALTPHLQTAVRVQAAMVSARIDATLQTLDAVSAVAFLLNESGRVVGLSAEADKAVSRADVLRLVGDRLRLAAQFEQASFDALLGTALMAARTGAPASPNWLHQCSNGDVIEVQALPRERNYLGLGSALLVLVRPAHAPDEQIAALRQMFGLTAAEAAITLAVADGEDLAAIAARRRVSRTTVRSQLQAVYAKMDVRRQAELAAAVRRLGLR